MRFMHTRSNELEAGSAGERRFAAGARAGQSGIHRDGRAGRVLVGFAFAAMPPLMRLLVAIHFRRLRVRWRDRFPRRGPGLLVVNHPSTWTDVVVLEVALGRKLHFLAHETLFRPAPRGWLLRLFGSLPVAQARDGAGHEARNALTFARCRRLLAGGEVVAVFPEGLSADDRSLRPFHTGAARIALDWIRTEGALLVLPVGLRYRDRTAFREDVEVRVGEPILLTASDAPSDDARFPWIESLTSRMSEAIGRLIAEPCQSEPSFEAGSRWVTRAVAAFVLLGSPLGAAGLLLHAPPVVVTALYVMRVTDPARVALARILGGVATFTAWYAAIAIAGAAGRWAWWSIGASIAVTGGLGLFALVWMDAVRSLRRRVRESPGFRPRAPGASR